ncbi:hypothetical protein [Corynebacterium testudinoris]|nr:hypothetical protein [Corynebacterium testudinoris]
MSSTDRYDRRKDRHTMGASRDFSTGNGSTAVLDRDQRVRSYAQPGSPPAAPGYLPGRDPRAPLPQRRRPYQKRLGSQQVVSVRGRRVAPSKQTPLLAKLSVLAIILFVGGVAAAMALSGMSTQQTFHMQQLVSQEKQLNNQIETLNRDLANASSSAELARRAGELGMAVPTQPGILAVAENGDIVEQRPADPATRPIMNINGAPVRPGQASTDPEAINELGNNLQAVPQGHQLPSNSTGAASAGATQAEPGVAPYMPNVPATGTDNN